MLYVKRWAPEDWPLAFQGQIHLLSSQDFALIEHEMRRTIERRSRRRERPPHRPRLPASAQVASIGLAARLAGGPIGGPREAARSTQIASADGSDASAVLSPGSPLAPSRQP
jgi:predicted alpha/beta-hydrolase family hydrolase